MADAHGNTGFDDKVREYAAGLLAEAEAGLGAIATLLKTLYPNPDHNAADRAQRNAAAARRDLTALRMALQALSASETGSQGPYWAPSDAPTSKGAET
jgi:hypothetical protein